MMRLGGLIPYHVFSSEGVLKLYIEDCLEHEKISLRNSKHNFQNKVIFSGKKYLAFCRSNRS